MTKRKVRMTQIRIQDDQVWQDFKHLAAMNNMSANGLMNTLMLQYVRRHNLTARPAAL